MLISVEYYVEVAECRKTITIFNVVEKVFFVGLRFALCFDSAGVATTAIYVYVCLFVWASAGTMCVRGWRTIAFLFLLLFAQLKLEHTYYLARIFPPMLIDF